MVRVRVRVRVRWMSRSDGSKCSVVCNIISIYSLASISHLPGTNTVTSHTATTDQ